MLPFLVDGGIEVCELASVSLNLDRFLLSFLSLPNELFVSHNFPDIDVENNPSQRECSYLDGPRFASYPQLLPYF